MPNGADRLVWIDCEMTGLDPAVDEIVEIAAIVIVFVSVLPIIIEFAKHRRAARAASVEA